MFKETMESVVNEFVGSVPDALTKFGAVIAVVSLLPGAVAVFAPYIEVLTPIMSWIASLGAIVGTWMALKGIWYTPRRE